MKTDVVTPVKVFKLSQRLVVPLFQRKYVWDEEGQWELLWDDIQRLADLLFADPNSTAQHFLGAVVLQEQDAAFGDLAWFSVTDGQQRLTTLQLLLDAAGAAFEDVGEFKLARVMDKLTHNDKDDISDPRKGKPSTVSVTLKRL